MENNITLYVISNGSQQFYPNNTLSNFKNRLPTPFIFNESNRWAMAIEAIGLSTDFQNITLPDSKNEYPSVIIPKNFQFTYEELINIYDKSDKNNENLKNLEYFKVTNDDYYLIYFEDKFYTKENFFSSLFTQLNIPKSDWTFDKSEINLFDVFKANLIILHPNVINDLDINLFPKNIQRLPLVWKETNIGGQKQISYINEEGKYDMSPIGIKNILFKGKEYIMFWNRLGSYNLIANLSNIEKRKYPSLIKVESKNISPQIHNSTFSNDLLLFCPDFKESDKYFFHEFENKQYVPLNNSILTNLKIKLVDEKDNLLHLLPGPATFLKLNIKKMNHYDRSFNIRVSSEKTNDFPKNTNSCFKIKLPNPLFLSKDWKVCLTSINMPSNFKTFPEDKEKRKIIFVNSFNNTIYEIILPEIIENNRDLIKALNSNVLISEFLKFSYLTVGSSNYLKITIKAKGQLKMHVNLAIFLGFHQLFLENDYHILNTNQDIFENTNFLNTWIYTCKNSVNFNNCKPNYMMVYSNIVNGSIIGSTICNILKIVPTRKHEDQYVLNEFKHNEFYDLQNTEINEIEISLRSHDGELINFQTNQNIIINLLFSNYS